MNKNLYILGEVKSKRFLLLSAKQNCCKNSNLDSVRRTNLFVIALKLEEQQEEAQPAAQQRLRCWGPQGPDVNRSPHRSSAIRSPDLCAYLWSRGARLRLELRLSSGLQFGASQGAQTTGTRSVLGTWQPVPGLGMSKQSIHQPFVNGQGSANIALLAVLGQKLRRENIY